MATTDKIIIRGLRFDAILGILDFERIDPQPLEMEITLTHDLSKAAKSGNLEDSINYAQVCEEVIAFVKERKALLIEALVEEVAEMILKRFKPQSVTLKILKLQILPNTTGVGVEITRYQDQR